MATGVQGPTVRSFIEFGFLPENLPPVVTSRDLWKTYENKSGYIVTKGVKGAPSPFSASKRGGQRRLFSLPHPSFVYDAASFFERHWEQIAPSLEAAKGSLSRPKFSSEGPRSVRITPHSDLPKARLQRFSRYRFCAMADVARCYPSIYTHSIPWAINGRENAKADQKYASADVFGNRLDFILRQAQDSQTVGIPVGPDTSRVTGEIVMSAVDRLFLSKYRASEAPAYLRHVDDYWIGGDSSDECERHLQNLRSALREYELDLNDLKTRIVPTNRVLGESWPSEFERELKLSLSLYDQGYDIVSTLIKIVDAAVERNDDGIIRHAIRKIDENKLWKRDWDILEHFLAQCAIQFNHSFDYVARVVSWRIRRGFEIDKPLWGHVVRSAVVQAASLGRDAEALWGLWLMNELRMLVPKAVSDIVVQNSSPLVLGYLAHMFANGRTRHKGIPQLLWSVVEGNPYSQASWPLVLELIHLDIVDGDLSPFAGSDDNIKCIFEDGRSLIDWNANPKVFDEDPISWSGQPDHAIEDFTSDYDHDDDDDDDDEVDFDIF